MTSVTNLQTRNPIWQRLLAALNCNLSCRQSPLSCILPSCLKHHATQGVGRCESSPLTAQGIYMPTSTTNSTRFSGITLLSTLPPKPPLHLASSVFFIEMYLVQMASHKTVGEFIYFKIFHQGKLTKMTQFIYKAIPRQNMLVEKSSK